MNCFTAPRGFAAGRYADASFRFTCKPEPGARHPSHDKQIVIASEIDGPEAYLAG